MRIPVQDSRGQPETNGTDSNRIGPRPSQPSFATKRSYLLLVLSGVYKEVWSCDIRGHVMMDGLSPTAKEINVEKRDPITRMDI